MASMDIFNQNAFSMISLTDAINKQPFKPSLLGRMGIFEEKSSRTTTVAIEEKTGSLALVPTTPRGAPAVQNTHNLRNLRDFRVPHIALEDRINAEEIQNVRAWQSESELQAVQSVVSERFSEMNDKIEVTLEYHRAGAIQGVIKDADGSTTLYNLFTEFGVSQDSTDFVLGTSTTEILDKCETVRGNIQDELGAEGGDDIEVLALCGATWFQKFRKHDLVRGPYEQWRTLMSGNTNGDPWTQDLRYKGFKFGDITFVVYRGSVGGVNFFPADEAYAFPLIPGLFQTVYAPADMMQFVNTPGLPRYAATIPDVRLNQYVELHLQTNPFCYCRRPGVLQKLTTSN